MPCGGYETFHLQAFPKVFHFVWWHANVVFTDRVQHTHRQSLGCTDRVQKGYVPCWWLKLPSILRWCFCSCWLIVLCTSHCLYGFCFGLCFGMHYFVSFIVSQSSWRERESWLLCFNFLSFVFLLLMLCCSS